MSPKILPTISKNIIILKLKELESIIDDERIYSDNIANNLQVTYNLLEILIENDDDNFIVETDDTRQLLDQVINIIEGYNQRDFNSPPLFTNNRSDQIEETTTNNLKSKEETTKYIKFCAFIVKLFNTLIVSEAPRIYIEESDDNANITEDLTPIITHDDSNSISLRPFNPDFIGKEGI